MAFRPGAHDTLHIDGLDYTVAEHPAAPGMPYGQEGRAAVVYRLIAAEAGEVRAFKVFKPRFQIPALVGLSERLEAFATLPGLLVCHRQVITARRNLELVRRYPGLNYAVIMPWIEGPTWMEVMLEGREITPQQSLDLARALTEILDRMEERGAAHCDLSGPNVLLPALAVGASGGNGHEASGARASDQSAIELVDVEQMFGEELKRPEFVPAGSSGYAHKTAAEGQWNARADRFAGSVLITEMLGWCDERVRKAAWGESYFDPEEMQQDTERYRLLRSVLRERWSEDIAHLLEQSWESDALADCATFGQWLAEIPDHPLDQAPQQDAPAPEVEQASVPPLISPSAPTTLPASAVKAREPGGLPQYVKEMLDEARRFEEKGNLAGALSTYREVLSMAPDGSALASEMPLIISQLEAKQNAPDKQTQSAPTPAVVAEPKPLSKPPEQVSSSTRAEAKESAPERRGNLRPPPPPPRPRPQTPNSTPAPTPTPMPMPTPTTPNLQAQMPAPAQGGAIPTPKQGSEPRPTWTASGAAEGGSGVAAPPPVSGPRYIDKLFDEALTKYQTGQLPGASELFGQVVRHQANYMRNGQGAAALLAETNRLMGRGPVIPAPAPTPAPAPVPNPTPAMNYQNYSVSNPTYFAPPAATATATTRRSFAPWIAALLLVVLIGGAAALWSMGVFGGKGGQGPAHPTTTATTLSVGFVPTDTVDASTPTALSSTEETPTAEPTPEPTSEPTTAPTSEAIAPTATTDVIANAAPTPTVLEFGPVEKQQPSGVSATSSSEPSFDSLHNETTYEPEKAIDGNKETTWRVAGDGKEQSIQLQFSQPIRVNTIRLIPGYSKVDPVDHTDRFIQNRRVKLVRFEFEDGTYTDASFSDSPEFQNTLIGGVTTRSLTIAILDTYPPSPSTGVAPRDYTAISEIEVVGAAQKP